MANWIKGPPIRDPSIAFKLIELGDHIFMGNKCQNASWARGWQIGMLINSVRRGHIFYAIPKESEK